MLDMQALTGSARHHDACEDFTVDTAKAASGVVRKLAYCAIDHCFYVIVDGRERIRSDMPETVIAFFNGPNFQ